jgi:hypothetical protein
MTGRLTQEDKDNIRIAFYTTISLSLTGIAATQMVPSTVSAIPHIIHHFAILVLDVFGLSYYAMGDVVHIFGKIAYLWRMAIHAVIHTYNSCPKGVILIAGLGLRPYVDVPIRRLEDVIESIRGEPTSLPPPQNKEEICKEFFGKALDGILELLFLWIESVQPSPPKMEPMFINMNTASEDKYMANLERFESMVQDLPLTSVKDGYTSENDTLPQKKGRTSPYKSVSAYRFGVKSGRRKHRKKIF